MSDNRIVTLWKEHKVAKCICEFSCGGDSMSDTMFKFFNEAGDELPEELVSEIEDFFQDDMYKKVEFYVNSDGHYNGEFGDVIITRNEDEEAEDEEAFEYYKDATGEYNESFVDADVQFPLTAAQKKFINDNVSNINGGEHDIAVNFKRDFIMTTVQETMIDKMKQRIKSFMYDRQPACDYEGELDESGLSYTTNQDGEVLKIVNNDLLFDVQYRSTVFKKDGEF